MAYAGLTGTVPTWNQNTTGSATTLIGTEVDWASYRSRTVANMLGWKNYGNGYVVFDASAGTAPNGTAVNTTNSSIAWSGALPTLMGWNGASTYGVRVDSARTSDNTMGNAATVGGLGVNPALNTTANAVVRTDGSGYVQFGYVNISIGNEGNNSNPPRVWGTNGTDGYVRSYLTSALSVNYATTATNQSGGSIVTGTNATAVGANGPTNTQFMGSASAASAISFHRAGSYAINMGMDTDNIFRLGGWSDGISIYRWTSDTAGNFWTRGAITATGNVTAYSDERLKTNWRDLPENFVGKLATVKVGIYDRLDVEQTQVGVSAQSLQELMPNAVNDNVDGMLSVAYGNAALASCVELAKEVVVLKATINTQQDMIDILITRLDNLTK